MSQPPKHPIPKLANYPSEPSPQPRRWQPQLGRVPLEIQLAFKELRQQGFFAEPEFWCCQSCGWAAVPEGAENVVFYHEQASDHLEKTGHSYLAWRGDANRVVEILRQFGISADWNGSPDTKIQFAIDVAWS